MILQTEPLLDKKSWEENKMALSNLNGWKKYLSATAVSCGASDKPEEKPAACGASDKPEEKPAACGTACGASDRQ